MQFAPLLTLGLLFGLATPALAQTATDVWTHAFTMTGGLEGDAARWVPRRDAGQESGR